MKYSGGVIYFSKIGRNNLNLLYNHFSNNIAQEAGGVFFCDIKESKCNCNICIFKNNKAISYGNNFASDIANIERISNRKIDYKSDEIYLTLGHRPSQAQG